MPTAGNFYGSIAYDPEVIPKIQSTKDYEKEIEKIADCYPQIKRRLQVSHQRASNRYNLRRRDVVFRPGDKVWKKNKVLSSAVEHFSAKLAPKYIPCKVTRRVGGLVYQLEDLDGNDLGRWHVEDIKPDITELMVPEEE